MAQKKNCRVVLFAVMAMALTMLLALSAFAATGRDGKIFDAVGYEAASVTINTTGDGFAIDEENVIDLDTEANSDLAGLYVIREKVAEGDPNAWSTDLIYVPAKVADRKNLMGHLATGTGYTNYGLSEFKPGWLSNWRSSYVNVKSAENEITVRCYGMGTGYNDVPNDTLSIEQLTEIAYNDLVTSTLFFKYAYMPTEIVPVSEVNSYKFAFTFGQKAGNGKIILNNSVVRYTAYVMDSNGNVTTYSYDTTIPSWGSGNPIEKAICSVDFTASTGWKDANGNATTIPASGYLVAFAADPFYSLDSVSFVLTDGGMTASNIEGQAYQPYFIHLIGDNDYSVDVVKYETPSVSLEGNVIKGLDENTAYEVAPVFVTGVGEATTVTGKTEHSLGENAAGLYVVRVKESEYMAASDWTTPMYVRGSYEARSKLGTFTNSVPATKKSTDFIVGTYTGDFLNDSFWDATHNIFFTGYSFKIVDKYTTTGSDLYNAYVAYNADTTNEVNRKAYEDLRDLAIGRLEAISFSYAYNADEIIPINEVVSMTFNAGAQYNPTAVRTLTPEIELYIIDKTTGVLTPYLIKGATQVVESFGSYAALSDTVVIADAIAARKLPEEGYLVGYKYYPFRGIIASEATGLSSTTHDGSRYQSPYITAPSELNTTQYVISIPKKDTPEIELDGLAVSGLDADEKYIIKPVTLGGAGVLTEGDAIELVDGAFTEGGLYNVYTAGDGENFANSDSVLVYAKNPDATERKLIGEVNEGALAVERVNEFVPGKVSGNIPAFAGLTNAYGSFANTHDRYFGRAYDDIALGDFAKANEIERENKFKELADKIEGSVFKYALAGKEIIPMNEVKSFSFALGYDAQGGVMKYFNLNNVTVRFVAYAMDKAGIVTFYTRDYTGQTRQMGAASFLTVDFNDNGWDIPEGSYFVGFEVYPYYSIGSYSDLDYDINDPNVQYPNLRTNFALLHSEGDYVTSDTYYEVEGVNLILEDTIGLTLQVNYDKEAKPEIKFVVGKEEYLATMNDGVAKITIPVAPKDYETAFTGDLYYGFTKIADDLALSVSTYIDELLANNDYAYAFDLVEALEVYCQYAKNNFSDDASLVNITLAQSEIDAINSSVRSKTGDLEAAGLKFYSTSLVLESETTIRHYFKIETPASYEQANFGDAVFTEAESNDGNSYVYVEQKNIGANNLLVKVPLVLTDATTGASMTIEFSVLDYVKLAMNDSDVKLQNLVKALYRYAVAAAEYNN